MKNQLTDNDIAVLKYIDDNPGSDTASLFNYFSVPAEARIEKLHSLNLIKDLRAFTGSTDKAHYLGLYCITPSGKAVLQDKTIEEKRKQYLIHHEWKIAIFSTFGGALAGLIASIVFWFLTK